MSVTIDAEFATVKYSEQCCICRHFIGWKPDAALGHCTAFPDAIPREIWQNEFDHKNPHAGDHGIRFELAIDPQ